MPTWRQCWQFTDCHLEKDWERLYDCVRLCQTVSVHLKILLSIYRLSISGFQVFCLRRLQQLDINHDWLELLSLFSLFASEGQYLEWNCIKWFQFRLLWSYHNIRFEKTIYFLINKSEMYWFGKIGKLFGKLSLSTNKHLIYGILKDQVVKIYFSV